jgi:lipopolysaccharide assembly protein B
MESIWLIAIPIAVVLVLTFVTLSRRRSRPDATALAAYVEGLRYLTTGDEQAAFVKFRQAVDQDTGNVDAYLKMGDIFRNRGLTDKALQIHRELTLRRDLPGEIRLEIDKSLAQDYIKANISGKAYEILERLVKDSSLKNWAAERLLDLYIKDKKWKEACDLYESILKKGSNDSGETLAGLKLMLGRELHNNEEYHKARLLYKEALAIGKGNPLPYIYIAESYLDEKRVENGLEFLKKLCEEVPRYAHLGFPLIEETLFNLGRFSEIEEIYRSIFLRDPSCVPAKIALAGILEKKGELTSAETLLKSVLEIEPTNSLAALKLVNIMAAKDRIDDGLNILSNVADKINLRSQEYKCRRCGKGLSRPIPACPQCGAIGTFI